MSAKILAFDPNRKVPARRYTPIAMRGRLLYMPARPAENAGLREARANTVSALKAVGERLVNAARLASSGCEAEPRRVSLNAVGWGSFPCPGTPSLKLK